MEVIIVALIVSLIAPLTLGFLTNRASNKAKKEEAAQRHKDKLEDWARQDVVAEKAAKAANLLVESNAEIAAVAKESRDITATKLSSIHHLVNSNMTAALQSQLDASVAQLALMHEVIHLKGGIASDEAKASMAILEEKIVELKTLIDDRSKI